MRDVHDVKPGALGIVAHEHSIHVLNVWTPRELDRGQFLSSFLFEGRAYDLTIHMPHGTFVLVVSEHEFLLSNKIATRFYRIIWNELFCFIRRDLVINPYINNEEL